MKKKISFSLPVITLVLLVLAGCNETQRSENEFRSSWPDGIQRTWIGPEYWANRLQDWELNDGRIRCLVSDWNRNVNLLTCRLGEQAGEFTLSVKTGLLNTAEPPTDKNWFGFRIGAKGEFNDYRDDAIYGKGLNLGITTAGDLFIGEPPVKLNGNARALIPRLATGVQLQAVYFHNETGPSLVLRALDPANGDLLAEIEEPGLAGPVLAGSMALVSHFPEISSRPETPSCWFEDWRITGDRVRCFPERVFGPLLFTQYTLSRGILKITAQMPPAGESDGQVVILETMDPGGRRWNKISEAPVDTLARTATFRIENWDSSRDVPFKLKYSLAGPRGKMIEYEREGLIRRDPVDREEIVVAGFTGNNDLGFPNTDLFEAIRFHDPDLLFFSGDQIYEGVAGFGVQREPVEKAVLDYLRKWYLYGWAYGDLFRNRPSVSIPDDHDVYHGNIWGEGGKATSPGLTGDAAQDDGGYKMPAEWVRMVERTQTSHLPGPYDPEPVEQGIGVYFCEMNYGGISFAILEDRKFKSAPKHLLPEAKITNGWAQNTRWDAATLGDAPGAILLGERQLRFLDAWAQDWSHNTWMKVALSQTIFANVATLPAGEYHDRIVPRLRILEEGEYPPDDMPVQDMDSNGWPQSGRNSALKALRKAFAFHIAGDQHLGSTVQYGINDWHDAGFALCVPAISNVWPRRWFPATPGLNRKENAPAYTGDFLDGFGNRITVHAVSNPVFTGQKPSNLYDRATGYGIVRFNRSTRDIVVECWPRFVDPSRPEAMQYKGWPVTLNQMDNYNRKPTGYLPEIRVQGLEDPVVRITDEKTGEVVYTLRIKGQNFKPAVFSPGPFTVEIGDPDEEVNLVYRNVRIADPDSTGILEVTFN